MHAHHADQNVEMGKAGFFPAPAAGRSSDAVQPARLHTPAPAMGNKGHKACAPAWHAARPHHAAAYRRTGGFHAGAWREGASMLTCLRAALLSTHARTHTHCPTQQRILWGVHALHASMPRCMPPGRVLPPYCVFRDSESGGWASAAGSGVPARGHEDDTNQFSTLRKEDRVHLMRLLRACIRV